MKRNYISFGIIILIIVVTVIVFREPNEEAVKIDKLKEENEKLNYQITYLEEKLDNTEHKVEELNIEKQQLAETVFQLGEDVESLKGIKYQDFNRAIETVESYKNAKSFEEAGESMSLAVGSFMQNRDGDCPCGFMFENKSFVWIPNGVLDLREFTIEKNIILLTYNTSKEIRGDYKFVLVKEDGWKINEINLR